MAYIRMLVLIPVIAFIGTTAVYAQQPPTPAKKGDKTGIVECDTYFAMVDACVATNKMTAEEKKLAEANVERLRLMLPIAKAAQGRATLVDRCNKSLELAQKNDKYGCYKPSPKPGGSR